LSSIETKHCIEKNSDQQMIHSNQQVLDAVCLVELIHKGKHFIMTVDVTSLAHLCDLVYLVSQSRVTKLISLHIRRVFS